MSRSPSFGIVRAGIGVSLLGGILAVVVPALVGTTPADAAVSAIPAGAVVVSNGAGTPSGCGTPDYGTIGAALSAATSGEIIYVCAGTYNESLSIATPDLTVLGPSGAPIP